MLHREWDSGEDGMGEKGGRSQTSVTGGEVVVVAARYEVEPCVQLGCAYARWWWQQGSSRVVAGSSRVAADSSGVVVGV